MTNKVPIIKVISELKKIPTSNPLMRDTVCLIGGFSNTEYSFEPTWVETWKEAVEIWGDDDSFDGNRTLKVLLEDNSLKGALIVNVTTQSGDTLQPNITLTKLGDAFTSLDLIDLDLLFVATDLADNFVDRINEFAGKRFEAKTPFGYVASLTRNTASAYETTSTKLGDWCYSAIVQRLEVENTEYDVVETGAFITKLIALQSISNSLTGKQVESITGINPMDIYTFGDGDYGALLTGYGYLLFRLTNASKGIYEAVNSANPNGLDLYISRVRDAFVNDFNLRQFFGEHNNTITADMVKMECNRIVALYKELGLITNATYTVQKVSKQTVEIIIDTLEFSDVITEIDVYITIEVQ